MKLTTVKICLIALAYVLLVKNFATSNNNNVLRNVEQRDYATILIIDHASPPYTIYVATANTHSKGEPIPAETVHIFSCNSLKNLYPAYQNDTGKSLSLAHLKCIIFSKKYYNSIEKNGPASILTELDQDPDVTRTCPLLFLQDTEKYAQYIQNNSGSTSSQLTDLMDIKRQQRQEIPTLANLIRYFQDHIPFTAYELKKENAHWIIHPI